jgi:endo-1,4-beta-xylanase
MNTRILRTAALSFSLAASACSGSDEAASTDNADETGGVDGSGGAQPGGHDAAASDGATGGKGGKGAGGTATAGGGTGSGGKGAGGATAAGGSTASGGKAGSGGSAAAGGGAGAGGTDLDAAACAVKTPLSGGTNVCSSSGGTLADGVAYSVWLSDNSTGTNCGNFYNVRAAFKATWNMPGGGDFLARAGLGWDKTKTYDLLGTVSADYAFTKNISGAITFIGIYGWSVSPLIEYYILEDRDGWWDPRSDGQKQGTFDVDGGTYELYTRTQTNQPSIEGTQTFTQFWSIRTSGRTCGHISISEHYKEWAKVGMTLGKMYEAKLLLEAVGGSGTVDFTNASVTAK